MVREKSSRRGPMLLLLCVSLGQRLCARRWRQLGPSWAHSLQPRASSLRVGGQRRLEFGPVGGELRAVVAWLHGWRSAASCRRARPASRGARMRLEGPCGAAFAGLLWASCAQRVRDGAEGNLSRHRCPALSEASLCAGPKTNIWPATTGHKLLTF